VYLRVSSKRMLLSVGLAIGAIQAYIALMNIEISAIFSLDAAFSLISILVGWFLSAIRLRLTVKLSSPNASCSLISCIKARFLGDVIAKITPSSIGGEPAREYYLAKVTK